MHGMAENQENQSSDLLELVGELVAAYVSNNPVRSSDLPDLIRNVHATLNELANGTAEAAPQAEIEKPSAAQIRKSVMPDGIVSFLDGKSYKTLKRHIGTHGLDPVSYRQRFGLPSDYPMVAPNYAAQRSALAKSIGLGQVANRAEPAQPKTKAR
jgi:predicted transcriptional regulator